MRALRILVWSVPLVFGVLWSSAQGSDKAISVRVVNATGRVLSLREGSLMGSGRWVLKPAASVTDSGEAIARFTADSPVTLTLIYDVAGVGKAVVQCQAGPGGITAISRVTPPAVSSQSAAGPDSASILLVSGSSRGLFDRIKKGFKKAAETIEEGVKTGADKTKEGLTTGASETKGFFTKIGNTLLPAFKRVCFDYYCSESGPKSSAATANRRWMEKIDSETLLNSLTIPGTHDSGALHGGPLIECQSWSIREQLDAGIRFLDIRCRHIQNTFAIHHGLKFQNAFFGDVLNECKAFLDANPSETIVMRVKEEYTASRNTRTFDQTFEDYRSRSARYWYSENRVPKLGEVRGKIVLVTAIGDHGMPWNSLNIQDDYEVPTIFQLNRKWQKVRDQLIAARSGPAATWYVNFASGSGAGCYPYTVATSINPSVLTFIDNRPARWGMVIMDFPGERLIDALIRTNARLVRR